MDEPRRTKKFYSLIIICILLGSVYIILSLSRDSDQEFHLPNIAINEHGNKVKQKLRLADVEERPDWKYPEMELSIQGELWTEHERIVAHKPNESMGVSDVRIDKIIEEMRVSELLQVKKAKSQKISITDGEIPAWLKTSSSIRVRIPPLRLLYANAFTNVSEYNPTDSATSFYEIVNSQNAYTLCDILEIRIVLRDRTGQIKTTGGGFIFARIESQNELASANPEDEIQDHNNGTYTAKFKLRWTGTIHIAVFLVYSSEAVSALRRVRDNYPSSHGYDGILWKDGTVAVVPCHVTPYFYIKAMENRSYSAEFCNYTDPLSGAPWFCGKPRNYSCSSLRFHASLGTMRSKYNYEFFSPTEKTLLKETYKKPREISSQEDSTVKVLSDSSNTMSRCSQTNHLKDNITKNSDFQSSGFYFNDKWISLNRPTLMPTHQNIIRCLRDKRLYFLGDSTLRQWFVYLIEEIGQYKLPKSLIDSPRFCVGMNHWKSDRYNISMQYHHHAEPVVFKWTSIGNIHYVANMIDSMPSEAETVYFLSVAAHFTIIDLNFFRGRLRAIKRAIARLHSRNPDTLIIVKNANTRHGNGQFNNWYHKDLNSVLIEEFSGLRNVFVVDVWSMTLGHSSGWKIHPVPVVVTNELAVALSYVCPILVN